MRAEQFIKDHGLERAREVVDGAPDEWADVYLDALDEYTFIAVPPTETDDFVSISDLKRLVESVDRVNQRGYSKTKEHLDYLISYGSEFGHVSKEEVSELTADLKNYESIYGEGNEAN